MVLPYPVVLASASPRRKELLARLVSDFEILVADVDEKSLVGHDPVATAERIAAAKAEAVRRLRPEALVVGGDTVVAAPDGEILGKPADADDAARMLRALSGREHRVVTGVRLLWPGGERSFADVTTVAFRPLTDAEIADYVAGGEPMDKAGAYAVQGGAGAFVAWIDGSLTNVVGLPLEALSRELSRVR